MHGGVAASLFRSRRRRRAFAQRFLNLLGLYTALRRKGRAAVAIIFRGLAS